MKINLNDMKRTSMKAAVYEQIMKAILKADFEPGQKLSEQELATMLGVSRTPVRETLIQLKQQGLVEIYPQRGTVVSFINREEVIQAQFIRESLEVATINKLLNVITKEQLDQLQTVVKKQQLTSIDQDYERFYELDEEFHGLLASYCGFPRVWAVIKKEKVQLDRIRFLSLPNRTVIDRLIKQHQQIINSLENKDQSLLVKTVVSHTREVLVTLEQMYKEKPSFFIE